MFLTQKNFSLPTFSPPNKSLPVPVRSVPSPSLTLSFDTTLSARLRSLLPFPASPSPALRLSWLAGAVDLLSLTLADASSLLLSQSLSENVSFLDSSSLSLLDSCNSIAAVSDQLLRRLLFLRFSLRSRKLITEPETRREMSPLTSPVPEIARCNEISPVARVTYALESVSALVTGAIAAALTGDANGRAIVKGLHAPGEVFLWAAEFNQVAEAVSGGIGEWFAAGEVAAIEMVVRRWTAVMDLESEEREADELRGGLERLRDSVNAVFRTGLCTRNVAVQCIRVGVADHQKM